MAPVYMTSQFAKSLKKLTNLWSVEIEDFDNESYSFEVTAKSADEAAHKATQMAANMGVYDVYNMFVYAI